MVIKEWTIEERVNNFLEENHGVTLDELKKEIATQCIWKIQRNNDYLVVEISRDLGIGGIDTDSSKEPNPQPHWTNFKSKVFVFSFKFPLHAYFEGIEPFFGVVLFNNEDFNADFHKFVVELFNWIIDTYREE